MSEGNVSLADGGFTTPSGAEVFLFHEVALGGGVYIIYSPAGQVGTTRAHA